MDERNSKCFNGHHRETFKGGLISVDAARMNINCKKKKKKPLTKEIRWTMSRDALRKLSLVTEWVSKWTDTNSTSYKLNRSKRVRILYFSFRDEMLHVEEMLREIFFFFFFFKGESGGITTQSSLIPPNLKLWRYICSNVKGEILCSVKLTGSQAS